MISKQMLKYSPLLLLALLISPGAAIADYRNSYSTPYGDTYQSRYGNQYKNWYQNKMNSMPYSNRSNHPPNIHQVPVYSNQVNNQNENQSGSVTLSDGTKPIKMEISHSEYLPSLPPSLRSGHSFDGWSNTELGRSRRRNSMVKFVIPKWLAGKWKRTQSKETKRVELPDGKELKTTGTTTTIVVDTFGTYFDGKGKIWQVFDPKRASGQVDRGDLIDHHRVMKYKIEILSPKSVVVEVVASHLVVNKEKNHIVKSFQDEELNTYTLLDNGKAKTESSVKVFDQLGKPVLLTHSISFVTKIQSAE